MANSIHSKEFAEFRRKCKMNRGSASLMSVQSKKMSGDSTLPVERKEKSVPHLPAHLKRYMTTACLRRVEPEITTEFDDVSSFKGRIVKADKDDPSVCEATRLVLQQLNIFRNNYNVGRHLTLISIESVNFESLEPEIDGCYYYITMKTENEHGKVATYQVKVFYSSPGSIWLRLFRPVPCEGNSSVSASATSQASSSGIVKREDGEMNLPSKKQKKEVAGQQVEE